jgi:hypothetical protein
MRLKQLSFPFWALKAERNMDNLRLNTTSYKFFLQLGFQKKQNNYRSYNKSSFILGFRDHITPGLEARAFCASRHAFQWPQRPLVM